MNFSRAVLIMCFLVFVGVIIAVQINTSEPVATGELNGNEADLHAVQEQWRAHIKASGSEQAYQEFKAAYKMDSYGRQHTLAHLFGLLLYEEAGISGLSVCDDAFAFGCYHSFFEAALHANGEGVLPELDRVCIDRWGSKNLPCQHGIGHGIMSYVGEGAIQEALSLCAKISWQSLGGCTSGVFMEYNFRTMRSLSGNDVRPFTPEDPYSPCSLLSDQFRPACYFELPQWWEAQLDGSYQEVGRLCALIENSGHRTICFNGAGNYAAASARFALDGIVTRCAAMPMDEGSIQCRLGASWVLLAQPNGQSLAEQLCFDLAEPWKTRCLDALYGNAFWINS